MQERISRRKQGQIWPQREPLQLRAALIIQITKRSLANTNPRSERQIFNEGQRGGTTPMKRVPWKSVWY
jgi:hypothetical protein